MDRQPLASFFFDELIKIAKEEELKDKAKKQVKGFGSHVVAHHLGELGERGLESLPRARMARRFNFLKNVAKGLIKGSSYIDDIESPPAQSLMPAIRAAHGLGKRSSWMDIPEGGRPERRQAWRPVDPPFKLAFAKLAYKLQGHTDVQGIPIAVENRKGSVRKGKDEDGHEWRTKMKHPYGYIKGTKGADGEEVDAYVGPDKEAPAAYVVHQRDKDTGKYDEDKVMLGFSSKAAAKAAFLAHYDSPKFLGPISKVSIDRLRELIRTKRRLVKIHE